jgi:eukaryotic-like serine/threonine-protein kinase
MQQGDMIAGRYRLEERLGLGGMSEVWAGTDTELERRVALKLLSPNADNARFEREARAVASLGHPNITQLYDYGEEDGRPYMVLEYLPGGTLEEHLQSGKPLPDDDVRRIAAELAAGLAHAHARGVVHRDLKPANVLFDQEGRAKLADFGIARMVAGEGTFTEAGTVLGTAAYISPEQAAGSPASAASDVYSFGVMLYRMLTGRLPFESNDPMELVILHRDSSPPPVTELRGDAPALLESTTTAAMAKDPADRPADGAALLVALGAPTGLSAFTTSASPPGDDTHATRVLPVAAAAFPPAPDAFGPPVGPPPRRNRVPLLVIGLLALLLAGAAVAYEVTRPASGSPSDTTPLTFPNPTTTHTQPTTTGSPTTTTTPSTQQTTTQLETTTAQTTAPPAPTTTALPPTTTAPPTTTSPPAPTTTALPPTTTAPPPTTTAVTPGVTGP